jgi:2-polyprenyl-6-methoxyphenol hydroxylase-like FAD-dependent oxidoreductase
MPQWDFLNFLSEKARAYSAFQLMMNTAATDVINEGGRVTGVRATAPNGTVDIHADVVVACDGRSSTLRSTMGITPRDLGAPMDVLWMSLSKRSTDQNAAFGFIGAGAVFVLIDRNDYWQCAYVIPKGTADEVRARGLDAFRTALASVAPVIADRVNEIKSWDDVKLLTVAVDRLERWHLPGLLFIGDSAHAMSPIGGVGINLAVQDAVATANRLAAPLKAGQLSDDDLAAIQQRRTFPVRFTQWMQLTIQKQLISRILQSQQRPKPPAILKLFGRFPVLRRIPARLVGMGVRPEHVDTPDSLAAAGGSRGA